MTTTLIIPHPSGDWLSQQLARQACVIEECIGGTGDVVQNP